MIKVFAIHVGCKYEGGVVREIYAGKEKAIKFAIMLVEEFRKRDVRIWTWEEMPAQGDAIKAWQSALDEVIVYQYELK